MNVMTLTKSILLLFIVYTSFLLNNSLSSLFKTDPFISSLIIAVILTDLLSKAYEWTFSNPPGLLFFLVTPFLLCIFSLSNNILVDNIIIFFGLFFYSYLYAILTHFSSLDDQLKIVSLEETLPQSNYTIATKKGIFFNKYTIYYANSLGFMSYVDKDNFLDIIKNNDGKMVFTSNVTITFTANKLGLNFIPSTRQSLLHEITDIDNILTNLLIEK